MIQDLKNNLKDRSRRAETAIEVCQQRIISLLPDLATAIDKMTWAEISEVTPHLSNLGTEAIEPFCKLLNSSRKQTIECVTTALAEIGDIRVVDPLIKMMEDQVGQSNALRARDALIQLGEKAIPGLISLLDSPKWEIRYCSIQALAVIGSPTAVDALLELSNNDRSSKVREAAEEALRFISYVDREKLYATYNGLFNPLLASSGSYSSDWIVDVININNESILWKFNINELEEINVSLEYIFCRSIFTAYQENKKNLQPLDLVVFMGDLLDENSYPLEYGIALLVSKEQAQSALQLMSIAEGVFQSLTGREIWNEPSVYWLGQTSLIPFFHLHSDKDLRYDRDDSYKPNEVWKDSPNDYGTNLQFISAKAALDQSLVYHDNLELLKERDIIKHIPQYRSIQHES
jgi:hypothetical protein